jgi:hypothetical protein
VIDDIQRVRFSEQSCQAHMRFLQPGKRRAVLQTYNQHWNDSVRLLAVCLTLFSFLYARMVEIKNSIESAATIPHRTT